MSFQKVMCKMTIVRKLAAASAVSIGLALVLMATMPQPGPGVMYQPDPNYTVPAAAPSFAAPSKRSTVTDFTFTDATGAPRRISAYRGKVVLVSFWATWCSPCIKELPSLSMLQLKMAGQPFEVLALSQDRGGADVVKAFYDQQKITNLKTYLDRDGTAGRTLGLRGLPTNILIDAAGREVVRIEGVSQWDDAEMVASIRRVLEGG